MNQRLANFEERLQQKVLDAGQGPGGPRKTAGSIVAEACNRVFGAFRKRRKGPGQAPRQGPQGPTAVETARATIHYWASQGQNQGQKRKKQNAIEALEWAWKERWNQDRQGRPTERLADRTPPSFLFTSRSLRKHQGLTKAQSSLLTQARTGTIGLRDFLFRAKVPEVYTPYCDCGQGRETVEHLVVWCSNPPTQRTWNPKEIRSREDLQTVLQGASPQKWLLRRVLNWLMGCGRLPQYSLTTRLALEMGEED